VDKNHGKGDYERQGDKKKKKIHKEKDYKMKSPMNNIK